MSADTQDTLIFQSWLKRVEARLLHEPSYHAALATMNPKVFTQRPGEGTDLVVLRGDEPQDAYDHGDTSVEYASFLLKEWAIYGPEGE